VYCFIRHGDPSAAADPSLRRTLQQVLGLDLDPSPLQCLAGIDRRLQPTAMALRGMRPPRFAGWFETFASVVPFQQLSLEAGIAAVRRLVERFGETVEIDGRRRYAFPDAAAVAAAHPEALRHCGLSRKKAESLHFIARAINAGELGAERIAGMATNDAVNTLVGLPGIGPWSASLVLLRGLGRLDVFPPGDVGAMRGLRKLLRLEPDAPFERTVARFGKRRGYLYFYALGGSLLEKGLIRPAPTRY
jgi:DNA-3-methyladenine glycosylase II